MSHIVKVKFTQIYDLKLITILAELGDHLKSEMIKKMKLDVHAVGDLYWSIKSKQIKVWLENADRSERIAEATIEEELIFIHTDSKVTADAIEKNYTKKEANRIVLKEIQKQVKHFPQLFVKWIPESENKGADQLARQALQQTIGKL